MEGEEQGVGEEERVPLRVKLGLPVEHEDGVVERVEVEHKVEVTVTVGEWE